MAYRVTLIPGDGIGPEVTQAAVEVVAATGVDVAWERHNAGAEALATAGKPVPEALINSVLTNKVALKGPVTTPIDAGFSSANVEMRKRLGLFANVRPVRTLAGVESRFEHVDLIVIRENSEDLYSGLEHVVVPGVVESLKIITEAASLRIGRFAFQYAIEHGRSLVTAVHKANIMKLADGLFLDCMRKASREYPSVAYEELIVDNTCMQLVLRPERFDVMVMENLYGDIVSDLCAGLVGGLGLTASANIGESGVGLFEAVHGSAPDIAGKGLANPIALMLSASMMLAHLGETGAAERIQRAVENVLAEGTTRTPDLGGSANTQAMTKAVIARL